MDFTREQLEKAAEIITSGGRRIVLSRALGISARQAMNLIDGMASGKFAAIIGSPTKKPTRVVDRVAQLLEQDMSPYEVALETGNSMTTVRNNILKTDPSHSPAEQELRKLAIDGVTYHKLQREFDFKTLEEAAEAIEQAFPGSYCSIIKDGDHTFLQPVASNSDKFEQYAARRDSRRFEYFVSPEENYIHIKMDDNLPGKELRIFNFTDVHFGSKHHRTSVFNQCLDLVKSDEMSFLFDGGDTTESITKQSVANPMEQFLNNNEQMDYATEKYGEVAEKIFLKMWGNHCGGRFEKTAELDGSRIIAQRLRVPYFRHRVIMDIEWRGHLWTIFVTHTWNKSHTQESVVREVKKVTADYTGFPIHFFCSGHNHNSFIQPVDVTKKITGRGMMKMRYHIVNGGSFLSKTGTYADEYSDSPQDLTFLRLKDDGSYLPGAIPILSL